MSLEIIVSAEAKRELSDAFEWYELQKPGLGVRFFDAVDKTVQKIALQPEAYSIKVKNYRSAIVADFPYLIIYEFQNKLNKLAVLQVFHTARYSD